MTEESAEISKQGPFGLFLITVPLKINLLFVLQSLIKKDLSLKIDFIIGNKIKFSIIEIHKKFV